MQNVLAGMNMPAIFVALMFGVQLMAALISMWSFSPQQQLSLLAVRSCV